MRRIKTFDLFEVIKVPIEIGDTVKGGRFKNKKIVVKKIGKNQKGDITLNGKPLLKVRIPKHNEEINIGKSLAGAALATSLSFGSPAHASPDPIKTEQITPLSKNTLLINVKNWVRKEFGSEKYALSDDKITVKCSIHYKPGPDLARTRQKFSEDLDDDRFSTGNTYLTIVFTIKDGKYEVEFDNINFVGNDGAKFTYEDAQNRAAKTYYGRYYKEYVDDLNSEIEDLIDSIKRSMRKGHK